MAPPTKRSCCSLPWMWGISSRLLATSVPCMDCFKIGKGVNQGCILSSCLFNLYTEYIMQNAELDKSQSGWNISNFRYANATTLKAESEEELKSLLIRVKEENEKAGLKLNIQKKKKKIMASSPITLWQVDGEKVEAVTDFILWAPKSLQTVTAAMKLKDLLLGRKPAANINSILKSRDITLLTTVYLVKAMVFPVVVYGCERWTIKKAECQRIYGFKWRCWRLVRVPWQQGDQASQS